MANKIVREIIHAKGIDIGIYTKDFENEYISLTDIAKYRNDNDPRFVIQNWMRNRNTVEFLAVWEELHNPDFNRVQFEAVRSEAGCLGYSLYRQLKDHAVDCKILAPSTMAVTNTYWTIAHLKWLKNLELSDLQRETLDKYLLTYEYLTEKINRFDERIEELASAERYEEIVKHMSCLLGIKTHTALSMIVEVGDFERFEKAPKFASFLGLVPSEDSSDTRVNRYSITKAGNSHLRRLLVEAAQSYTRGNVGHKSVALRQRQQGNPPEAIAYADKANERLRRRFYKMTLNKGVNRNVAATAIARELACFIWGMMTEHVS